ncbi:hypothetical protein [Streptomyces sp. MP131-18]|uniref:hypothetical protein n=1 Tax=Streptomyces sp. MP131-18 TaxID=1857892 RepID=UPI00097BCB31|nr:hypothetical protein [Streptomyces sp. MP131-18]ONK10365.1 hypothetical protein STBA_10870 [Streptomyces sp. MP131-18]
MTDLERTKEFLESLGVRGFKEVTHEDSIALVLRPGMHKVVGWSEALLVWRFHPDGTFKEIGVWE